MKNERTSKHVAKTAAQIFGADHVGDLYITNGSRETRISGAIVRSCMASLVTQTADKKAKPFTSLSEARKAAKKLRPYTVDAFEIPELGETFGPRKRKTKRKAKRK